MHFWWDLYGIFGLVEKHPKSILWIQVLEIHSGFLEGLPRDYASGGPKAVCIWFSKTNGETHGHESIAKIWGCNLVE